MFYIWQYLVMSRITGGARIFSENFQEKKQMRTNYGVDCLWSLGPALFRTMRSVTHLRSLTLSTFLHEHKAYATECTILVMSGQKRGTGRIEEPEKVLFEY